VNNLPQPVSAIIVTYNPERSQLLALVCALLPQVGSIVIVDNGSSFESIRFIKEITGSHPIEVILLGVNLGIAAAQNKGIDHARDLGSKYVMLFDHDSKPSGNMVSKLMTALQKKEGLGLKVAAVGPNFSTEHIPNLKPFRVAKGFRVDRHGCPKSTSVIQVSYLIASGSLIPMSTLNAIGGMCDDLFIDYVDIEWGLRASQNGYSSFGVCGALMEHDLGDLPLHFFGMSIPNHSPLRHYYLFRNAVWLYRQEYLPLQWRIGDAWRLLLKYGFYSLYGKPRLAHIKMMSKGIWHGLIGQLGQFK
jgi:rhamnosyltransferase